MPRRSKRVLAHVHGAQQLGEFAENLVHGKGRNGYLCTLAAKGLFCYNSLMSSDRTTEPKPAEKTVDTKDGAVLVPAIARLGLPVGIFGATFFLIALSLTMLFSPDRFPVRVGDKTVRLHELESEEKGLQNKKAELTEERRRILADSDAPVLHQVERLRSEMSPVGSAMLSVEDVRRSFRSPSADPISLPGVFFDGTANALVLDGEIRDTGGRSMQLLATFVDELRAIPDFVSVSEPEYTSEPLPGGGSLSKFTLTLRFHRE